ncbi:MAG: NUDIX hydrolase [Candidatus Hodarchaeales archaeon]|jgi:8-oxo-dGTP pyrophosphatase MutT (NUDIX family)
MLNLSGFKAWINKTEKHIWPEIVQNNKYIIENLRPAGIMIILIQDTQSVSSDYSLVFGQRSDDVPKHKGQCAFPGGGKQIDESLLNTAIRETKEEIGVSINFDDNCWEFLGQYPVDFVTISNYLISPFVVVYHTHNGNRLSYKPDGYEITDVFEVPIKHLLNPDNKKMEKREFIGILYDLYYYYYKNKVIWGVTGMILDHFLLNMKQFLTKD